MEKIGELVVGLVMLGLIMRVIKRRIIRSLYGLTGSRRITVWIYALMFLPGTYFHEASHALMARLLGVRIGGMSLRPKLKGRGIRLGSVEIEKVDVVRRLMVGVAPVILGTLAMVVFYQLAKRGEWSGRAWVVGGYLVFEIGSGMALSRKDLMGF